MSLDEDVKTIRQALKYGGEEVTALAALDRLEAENARMAQEAEISTGWFDQARAELAAANERRAS